MEQPIGVAIFGAGRWGTHLIRNFLAHPQAQLLALVDPEPRRLAAIAQQFALNQRQQPIYLSSDWQAGMAYPGVEAVAIATPASTHYGLIQAALQRGHHVLAEKPLALEVAECQALCELAATQQRQLVIDRTYLFHPAVVQGQAIVQSHQLGQLHYGYATRTHLGPVRRDVDALWDLAIHDLAIFNNWLGETPRQVQAQGLQWLPAENQPGGGLADLVWVSLTYPSGFQARIHLCWANPDKQRRLGLVGSEGTLVFDELAPDPLVLYGGGWAATEPGWQPHPVKQTPIEVATGEPLERVCDHFLHYVQTRQPSPISSGWLGTQLVQTLTALSQSLRQGGQVVQLA